MFYPKSSKNGVMTIDLHSLSTDSRQFDHSPMESFLKCHQHFLFMSLMYMFEVRLQQRNLRDEEQKRDCKYLKTCTSA